MFPFLQTQDNLDQRRQLQKQRLYHRLHLQSTQIEKVMNAHRLPAQVSGGRVTSQTVQFDLQTQSSSGWDKLRLLTLDLRHALGVPEISITRENGRLQVAVARPVEAPVRLLDVIAMVGELKGETAVIGLSTEGKPVLLSLNKGHILISGVKGAGKTSMLRAIALSLALSNRPSRLQQVIIAPIFENNNAFAELEPLTILPHLSANIDFHIEESTQYLDWLVAEMENRLRQGETSPKIIVMIDQVVELMVTGGESTSDAITRLLQRGARAGIHLILTTACPDSELLDSHLKANLTFRITGQVTDAVQAAAATGLENSEAEHLLGKGDFLLVERGQQQYFQAAYISDYDLHLSLKKVQQNFKVSLMAQPFYVRPKLADPRPEPIPASFWLRSNGAVDISEEDE
jgi:S-DNA-T family DNA segregation ATPase FtsK/SpoIIIE